MPELLLAPGTYTLGVTATPAGAPRPTAWRFGRTTLYVQGRGESGVFTQPFECRVSDAVTARRGNTSLVSTAPLVSVVIPSYNHAHFLGEAISSVLAQEYPRIEVVVVNDGSSDDTAQIAARFPEVRYIEQPNRGLAAARNAGLAVCTGELVVFLDADDRLLPGALETGMRALAAEPAAGFAAGYSRFISRDGTALPTGQPPRAPGEDPYVHLLRRNRIRNPAMVMFRRDVVSRAGGFAAGIDACADYDLYLRISRAWPVVFHDQVVADYRKHGGNMSDNSALMLRQLRRRHAASAPVPGRSGAPAGVQGRPAEHPLGHSATAS